MNWIDEKFLDLDSDETFKFDPGESYKWIYNWDRLLDDAAKRYIGNSDLSGIDATSINEILICGMGGSAIAGDVALAVYGDRIPVPSRVIRGYGLPESVSEKTLLIAISYSGNTEESLSAYASGRDRGAKIIVLSSGGKLESMAGKDGYPFLKLDGSIPAPRLALPHLLVGLLAVLECIFPSIENISDDIRGAIDALGEKKDRYGKSMPTESNQAKKLAKDFHGVFPVIVGSELTWPIAVRFQAQLNENAKWPAHASALPEMNHNEIVAYSNQGPATSVIGLIMLKDEDDNPRTKLRQDFTIDLVKDKVRWVREIMGDGSGRLARFLTLIQLADFSTYYLACGRGLDPMNIDVIEKLKNKLGKSGDK